MATSSPPPSDFDTIATDEPFENISIFKPKSNSFLVCNMATNARNYVLGRNRVATSRSINIFSINRTSSFTDAVSAILVSIISTTFGRKRSAFSCILAYHLSAMKPVLLMLRLGQGRPSPFSVSERPYILVIGVN